MDTTSEDQLKAIFPRLCSTSFRITSPPDPRYNCIAWAAGDNQRWWEPDRMGLYYWPSSVPREYTLEALRGAFESLGFTTSVTDDFDPSATRVSLFAKGSQPTHASRQLSPSEWTSKIGPNVDISHELHALVGSSYGAPSIMLRRPHPATT